MVRSPVSLTCAVVVVVTVIAPATRADERAEIQELLDRRAHAVLDRDRRAFAATIAPARAKFRRAQLASFDHMGNLPLGSYRLVLRWDRLGDLARASDRKRYPGADAVVIPITEERYRLAGYDRADAVEDIFFTFVRRGTRWQIASDTDLDDVSIFSARHPWDFYPLRAREGDHFLLLEPACSACAVAPPSALALAEAAPSGELKALGESPVERAGRRLLNEECQGRDGALVSCVFRYTLLDPGWDERPGRLTRRNMKDLVGQDIDGGVVCPTNECFRIQDDSVPRVVNPMIEVDG